MSTFIEQLVDDLIYGHTGTLHKLCIVFPTRRAGLFFQKELSSRLDAPIWSPKIYSIQDFILSLSGKKIPDQLTLLFELYKVYKDFFPREDFSGFYSWGELLLKDFDDIDKNLIDATKIFALINDLNEIDREFELAEEDLERLRIFWKNFFNKDVSLLRTEFVNTWKHLPAIYSKFKNNLKRLNLSYEGMAYRELAIDLSKRKKSVMSDYSHFVFAGFYALSPAEQKIINSFIESGNATVYWDADKYYVDDPVQEAGRFFRNNRLITNDFKWKQDHFATTPKQIEFAGIPLVVGQAKYMSTIVKKLMLEPGFRSEKTAIVMPDEKLLFPVLYSLPDEIQHVNVTMGYPLRQTPLYNLFDSLITLQNNAREEKGEITYYFRDILNVLNHPYVRLIADRKIRSWLDSIKQNFIRMPGSMLTNHPDLPEIFTRPVNVEDGFKWFRKILKMILSSMKDQQFRFHRLESEFVYQYYTHLRRLEDIIAKSDVVTDLSTFWKIFREIIFTAKVPFTGEPLLGVQIMGFLETRVLDFDNVIILTVNEDTLPATRGEASFIPFSIRKAFGLSTHEEQNAVSAFHFFRLMQRAKNIYLIHNTEAHGLTAGERSRYMLQIEHELVRKFPHIKLTQKIIGTPIGRENIEELTVTKTPDVLKELSKYISNDKGITSFPISPTALIAYISCPLRFYFRYVAGMKEPDEQEENMEAATFGNVLHKTMELLYNGITTVDDRIINKVKAAINDRVDEAIHQEFVSINQLEGKNILLRNVLRELVSRIVESDRKNIPFKILQLEKDVSRPFILGDGKEVRLYGKVDRVDEKENIVRIIDYKSGKVGKKKPDSLEDYFTDPQMKEQFQAMYYAFLARNVYQGKQIKSGLLIMRDMNEGIWFLNKDNVFSEDQFAEFETLLRTKLEEIFSPDVPFNQTIDDTRCNYCAFKSLCNRN